MAFWGCVLAAGQKKSVESPEGEILHLSQACLHNPVDGKNYIQAEVNGTTYSIACLEKGKKEHDSFDLFFDPTTCSFKNQGKSEVHLTGYFEPDEGLDEDEEEEKPPAKAASKSPEMKAKAASPKVEAKKSPQVVAKESPKVAAKASPKAAPKAAPEESDDDDEEGEEEEMILEEGEEEEEQEESEEEDEPPAAQAKTGKRKAEGAAKEAPPAKKAAAGSPSASPAPSNQADYVKQLVAYLKKNGKTTVSQLGSKVTRPAGAPKMKAIFSQNPDKFAVQGEFVTAK